MSPIYVSSTAAQILGYPQPLESQKNLKGYLASKLRSTVFSEQPVNGTALVRQFQSGRRHYVCRVFRVDSLGNSNSQSCVAVILERSPARPTALVQLSERFRLTNREQEVAQLLLQGLTSKEIGTRMRISPNTVKAFLRLIMVKMGVSTRSGILGKALTIEPPPLNVEVTIP